MQPPRRTRRTRRPVAISFPTSSTKFAVPGQEAPNRPAVTRQPPASPRLLASHHHPTRSARVRRLGTCTDNLAHQPHGQIGSSVGFVKCVKCFELAVRRLNRRQPARSGNSHWPDEYRRNEYCSRKPAFRPIHTTRPERTLRLWPESGSNALVTCRSVTGGCQWSIS